MDKTNSLKAEIEIALRDKTIIERNKELNCLYKVAETCNNSDLSKFQILKLCANFIPPSMQFPEICSCRISYKSNEFVSDNFKEGSEKIECAIQENKINIGKLEVFYTKNESYKTQFLIEEEKLIDSVTKMIEMLIKRKSVEQKVIESEEKYRYLFNNSPGLIIIWDLEELKILEVSDNVLDVYGYSREEFIGMSVMQYRPKIFHDDIRVFAKQMLANNDVKSRNTWIHLKKKGEEMYMDISSHKIDYNGKKAILSLAVNVTEQTLAEQKLLNANNAIRKLNTHIETVRDEERLSLSRELHDDIGQHLTVLSLHFSFLLSRIESNGEIDSEIQPLITNIAKAINNAVESVRRISSYLRGSLLEDKTIIHAINSQCDQLKESSGIKCVITFDDQINQLPFKQEFTLAVFRIFQESVTNIIKYASANEVEIILKIEVNYFYLIITDNGKGFIEETKRKNSLGLIGMEERAILLGGKVTIHSDIGKGTKIELKIPLEGNLN